MLRLFYSVLLLLAVPFIVLRLYIKSLASVGYRQRVGERFGFFAQPASNGSDADPIWIHAVSVGEVNATKPLIEALQQAGPQNIVITTTTPTGAERVRILYGDRVLHLYAPYDLGFVLKRVISKLQPKLLILMETELWPNMLHCCREQGVKILLANARLSEKSARGYARLGSLSKAMLQAIDHIAAQAQADADRFLALGAKPQNLSVTGSLKFYVDAGDSSSTDSFFASVKAANRTVVIAASTREGEEIKVLAGFEQVRQHESNPLLLIVPRHPERFEKVATLVEEQNLVCQRRSQSEALNVDTEVLVGDSMGELMAYLDLADIAFVGGSLVDTGCQNVLEPAALGKPIIVGPSQFNFATICAQLELAEALITVADSTALGETLLALLNDSEKRQRMGSAGKRVVAENRDALPKLLAITQQLLAS